MKKIIKILGTGCPKCKKTIELIKNVVSENNFDAEVVKVDDIMDIMKYDVLSTPAVVVDEQVMIKGRVPKREEIVGLLLL